MDKRTFSVEQVVDAVRASCTCGRGGAGATGVVCPACQVYRRLGAGGGAPAAIRMSADAMATLGFAVLDALSQHPQWIVPQHALDLQRAVLESILHPNLWWALRCIGQWGEQLRLTAADAVEPADTEVPS